MLACGMYCIQLLVQLESYHPGVKIARVADVVQHLGSADSVALSANVIQ